jgi:hypothetical protein
VRPELLRGTVSIDGLVLERSQRHRALRLWATTCQLEELDDGRLLLAFGEQRMVRVENALGAPVVRAGAGWADHRSDAEVASGTVAVLRAGSVVEQTVVGLVDPGTLLDLSGWTVVEAVSPVSSTPPTAPAPIALPPDPDLIDVRSALGGLPPPDDATRRRWRAIAGDLPPRATRVGRARGPAGHGAGAPARPSPLRTWWSALLTSGPRSRRKHERYLEELRDLFERGEVDEALRRAIPLGGEGGPDGWGVPRRRSELAIDLLRTGGGPTSRVDALTQASLRDTYRAAHERLDRQGRVNEAAFVLADLLDDTLGACAYLERHDEVGLAAALADARSDDHALRVRLWWKAGDRTRAITVARRHGCFAAAVTRLERAGDRDDARALRRIWASRLAAAGDLVGTVDALAGCDDTESTSLRDRAMSLGLDAGGPVRAQMVVRALRSGHSCADEAVNLVLRHGDAAERQLVADGLAQATAPLPEPVLIRPLVRRMLADEGHMPTVRRLAGQAGDPVLEADLPAGPRPTPEDPPPVDVQLHTDDRGLVAVRQARVLPDGTVVAAIDEVGLRLFRPDGRRIADLDLAVDFVVPSDTGAHVIAGRRLGPGTVAIWSVDIRARRAMPLGEIQASVWASTYDGGTWFLAHGETLWMLDMLADGPTALWAQGGLGGSVVCIARSPTSLAVAAFSDNAGAGRLVADCYVFRLPDLVGIRHRRQVIAPYSDLLADGSVVGGAVDSDEHYVVAGTERGGDGLAVGAWGRRHRELAARFVLPAGTGWAAALDHGNLVLADDAGRIERVDLGRRARLPPIRVTI